MSAPILIAGAGIGGLSAAIALAREGFDVKVFERASEIREVGAGLQVGPNGIRAFEKLGVAQEIREIAFRPEAIVLMDSPSGTEICRQELTQSFLDRFGHPYQVAFRADVQGVLLEAARGYSDRIEFHLGNGVRKLEQDQERVVVQLDDGSSATGASLIGADGLWSEVRSFVVGDGRPRVSGHIAYRAVLAADQVPVDILTDNVQVWVGPRHHLVCYKLRGGELFNIVAIFHSSRYLEGWDKEADLAELRSGFADACDRVQRLLDHVQAWRMWVLCDRDPVQHWTEGRVTLLGDAAHPMLPYLAQGACMAVEDSVCLAALLAETPADIASAFFAYENARFPRTSSVQLAAREMGVANHLDGEARERRNVALAARNPRDHESNAWLFETDGPRPALSGQGFFGRVR
ncbi:MAG: 3-hydroxybenzoate-6-hydroxylase [Nevskia sp.]|nr:3-hydroxybenzoate-6-hydroxylase [Nevskia sp.]